MQAAVNPVRAAVDNSMPGRGDFTIAEVMLTILPNRRARMPGSTARISINGASMLLPTAASQSDSAKSAKSPGLGPRLLVTRISGSGQAALNTSRPAW